MHLWKLFLLTLLLTVVACSNEAPAPVEPASIDIATLPEGIDVQTAAALQSREDVVFIDVREQHEYDAGHIPDITLIPISTIQNRLEEIPTDKTVILACHSGTRSRQVFDWLQEQGYDNVHDMEGGIVAWEKAGLEVEK